MPTLADMYQTLCTEHRLPESRQKNIRTALRYLAASHAATPETLALSDELEAGYKDHLRAFLRTQGKGASTIRNTIQEVGQCLRAWHGRDGTPTVPVRKPTTPHARTAVRAMAAISPYRHQGWLIANRYYLPHAQWPAEIRLAFDAYRARVRDRIRLATLRKYQAHLEAYLGYLSRTPEARLARIHPDARQKLLLKRYQDDVQTISAPPQTLTWDTLFDLSSLRGFVTWHSWRAQTPRDARVHERPPSKPSSQGDCVAEALLLFAHGLERPEADAIYAFTRQLGKPRKIHNKGAECHTFTFAELEQVALALIDEGRRINPAEWVYRKSTAPRTRSYAAGRFAVGLILMLGWRIPLRARNWCEMLLDTHLRKVGGHWRIHFEGHDLKVGHRQGAVNVFDIQVPVEVVPYLEEYLTVWRPRLLAGQEDQHVFLNTKSGHMMSPQHLHGKLSTHVYRYTGKRFFPHLFRTVFTSNMLASGLDINSVAFGLNDSTLTVLKSYNELQAGRHQLSLQDAYRRALKGGIS